MNVDPTLIDFALAAGAAGGLSLAGGPAPQRLPRLRDDLTLNPGPTSADGAPTWTLYDPAANRFLRIGWREFEILARWDRGTADRVAAAVRRDTRFDVTGVEVEGVARFLENAHAVQASEQAAVDRLHADWLNRRQHPLMWAVKNYLFVRVPLVRPDRFLDATLSLVRPLLGRGFAYLMLVVAALGLFLVTRQWESFTGGFAYLITPAGLVTAGVCLLLSKTLHELAHAYVCKKHGCRVAHMGLALLVLWPVLYTDTTDAWRLTSRSKRIEIDLAGIAAELALAAAATLVWTLLPDGPLRAVVFTLAAVTWLLTLAINLNPFMRFDGYYLLSDLWDVPNLQERGFALGRWALREALFAPGYPPPEPMPRARRRRLIAYAYGTWIYRFFLFLGIALLVYHLFFKVLGILLMVVELGYFIVRPVARELGHWWSLRKRIGFNRRIGATLLVGAALVGLVAVPWQTRFSGPALLREAERGGLYAPRPAQVSAVLTREGAEVGADTPLIELASPDLAYEIAKAEREIATLRRELSGFGGADDLAARRRLVQRSLLETTAKLAGLEADRAELTLRAPFDGRTTELADHLRAGMWVTADEKLGQVGRDLASTIEAFVTEEELPRIAVGAAARFYPESPDWAPVEASVVSVDTSAIRRIDLPELASVHGGGLPARADTDGTLKPERALYRVRLAPARTLETDFALRGSALIWGERESFAARIWRRAVGLAVRESGF